MRPIILLFLGMILFHAVAADNSETFSSYVSQLWFDGKKDEVLAIAKARLAKDPEDLAGLSLKMDYEIEFLKTKDLKLTIDKLQTVGKKISTPNALQAFKLMDESIVALRTLIPEITPEMIAEDLPKARLKKKPLSCLFFLQALEKDNVGSLSSFTTPNSPTDGKK